MLQVGARKYTPYEKRWSEERVRILLGRERYACCVFGATHRSMARALFSSSSRFDLLLGPGSKLLAAELRFGTAYNTNLASR